MSELFDQLYDAAVRREHGRINRINQIQELYAPGFTRASSILNRLDEQHQLFEADLDAVVQKNRMRVRKGKYVCLLCKKSDCPDAVFVSDSKLAMSPAELVAYMNNFPQG